MSPESSASKYVIYEFAYAWALGIKVIPVMLRYVENKEFHPRLGGIQYISFHLGSTPWTELIARLQELIAQHNSSSILIPPDAPQAITNLLPLLDDPDLRTHETAIKNLIQIKYHGISEILVLLALHHPYRDVRIYSAYQLSHFAQLSEKQQVALIPILLEAVQFGNMVLQDYAGRMLIGMGNLSIPSLLEVWQKNDPIAFADSVERILKEIGKPVLPYMTNLLNNSDSYLRRRVVWYLETIKDEESNLALVTVLNDSDPFIRGYAARVLGERKIEGIVPNLRELLTDHRISAGDVFTVADWAVVALVLIGNTESYNTVLPYLKRQLTDTSYIYFSSGPTRRCDYAREGLHHILEKTGRNDIRDLLERTDVHFNENNG